MKTILVSDDDLQILTSMKRMLENYYEVDTATTATETIEKIDHKIYDGLIIDVEFKSGINGLETVELLREEGHVALKIIIFSATDYSHRVRQRAVELGASFLEKPIDLNKIRSIMDGALS